MTCIVTYVQLTHLNPILTLRTVTMSSKLGFLKQTGESFFIVI